MKITKIGTASLFTSCFICLSLAEDRAEPRSAKEPHSIAAGRSAETYDLAVSATTKASRSGVAATGTSEVFQNIVIAPGKNVSQDSTLDYSSASTVAVAVQCSVCSTASASLGTSGLVLQARWTVPNAGSYVATENMAATGFPYWDAGGAVFNVYGSTFRLILQNQGSQTIAIQQITVFRRSQ